jgi:voltage-gated potassium channel
LAAIEGDATRREVLRRAEIIKAREVIITLDRDDSAILVTLTVRQLNPSAHVVVAVREEDNASLVRQSGANAVITSSEAVGRLLGLSAVSPHLGTVIEDLLSSNEGLEVGERQVTAEEVGKAPDEVRSERVIAVVRASPGPLPPRLDWTSDAVTTSRDRLVTAEAGRQRREMQQ